MKIISGARNLAKAALCSGFQVVQRDDFPITVRSGHSVSSLKFSREPIEYLGIDRPDLVIVLSEDGLKKVRPTLQQLDKGALVMARLGLAIETPAKIFWIDPAGVHDKSLTAVAITRMIEMTGLIPLKDFRDVLLEKGEQNGKTRLS